MTDISSTVEDLVSKLKEQGFSVELIPISEGDEMASENVSTTPPADDITAADTTDTGESISATSDAAATSTDTSTPAVEEPSEPTDSVPVTLESIASQVIDHENRIKALEG